MTDQLDLLSYPDRPGFKARDTSRKAAGAAIPLKYSHKIFALRLIRSALSAGLTADEAAEKLGLSILSIRPRVTELARKGLIRDSGQRRNNASGKSAIVWVRND